jgi:hypothetical protein|nr:IPT/TIG domain-containing protein [Kofleriaceae bacterium]
MTPRIPLLAAAIAVAAACGSPSTGVPPVVSGAQPAFGPLAGGTIVELAGSGFLADAAAPDHVVVGGTESPLASVIDDNTLQFVLPPSVIAGDAEIDVFNQNGTGSATGVFHYSSAPVITAITPGDVLFSSTTTTMTATGSGFQSEDAGTVTVLLNGTPAVDVEVQSDNQLTFTALPDHPLVTPTVVVSDARGSGALAPGFRYVPSTNPGLILFPNDGRTFFTFFDPVAQTTISVPLTAPNASGLHFRAVVAQADKTFLAFRSDGQFGVLDMSTQQITSPVTVADRIPAATGLGGKVYGVSMSRSQLVTVDPVTGIATRLGTATLQCCGVGLAANGSGQMFFVGETPQTTISKLDPATGALSGAVTLSPAFHVADMRFLGGTLFAVAANQLITIDPGTGSAAVVSELPATVTALEVLQ